MACRTKAGDGMEIGPLSGLPVIRDLVTDRDAVAEAIKRGGVYSGAVVEENAPVKEDEAGARLRRCLGCLACLSTCEKRAATPEFIGPYVFVKLAQFELDPRDNADRRQQALDLGLEYCAGCKEKSCYCINGIQIKKDVLGTLLSDTIL